MEFADKLTLRTNPGEAELLSGGLLDTFSRFGDAPISVSAERLTPPLPDDPTLLVFDEELLILLPAFTREALAEDNNGSKSG